MKKKAAKRNKKGRNEFRRRTACRQSCSGQVPSSIGGSRRY